MNQPARARHPIYNLLPMDVEGFASRAELALDLRSSWNHVTDDVWEKLDSRLWDITHNPWVVLQTVSRSRIESVMADPVFRKQVERLVQIRRHAAETPAWFQQNHAASTLTCVAYFSMEFMLSEALPIYSGGLGNVAGDQLKANSDLGVPVVGVGLLYQEVIPEFYSRDANGIPTAWVQRMRQSMSRLTPRFSADRTVRDYTEQHYLPAAAAYRERAADKGANGRQLIGSRR